MVDEETKPRDGEENEWLELVDASGESTGRMRRDECHGNPNATHRAVHVLVFNAKGSLYLQKRARNKQVCPGLWDSSVGGHVAPDESYYTFAARSVWEGRVPYRDFAYTQMPFVPYINGLVMTIIGFGLDNHRLASSIWGVRLLPLMSRSFSRSTQPRSSGMLGSR